MATNKGFKKSDGKARHPLRRQSGSFYIADVEMEIGIARSMALPRRRHEIGEPVEELKRRELEDAVGVRPRGLAAAAGPDPGPVRLVTAEDLILSKLLAGRPRDLLDIKDLLFMQGQLDEASMRRWAMPMPLGLAGQLEQALAERYLKTSLVVAASPTWLNRSW